MVLLSKKKLGDLGEKIAGEHLEGLGHRILERNYRFGHLEIDLITAAPDGVHFVEVKSLMAPVAEDPTEKVGHSKRSRVTAAALHYLNSDALPAGSPMEAFFDIVSVVFDGDRTKVEYYPSAWIPIYT